MFVYIGLCGNKAVDKSAKKAIDRRFKKLRRGGIKKKDILSTAAKAQWVKKLLFAKKTQAIKNTMRE